MHAAGHDRLEFAPPPQPGLLRAGVLAVIAHLLLLLALTWGVSWKREAENMSAEAELWSAVPQQAAPKLVEPTPRPAPPPPPPPAAAPQPAPPPVVRDADIALEREKQRKAEEKARQLAQERERQKALAREKLEAQKKQQQEALKQELARKAEEEKKKKVADAAKARSAQQQEEARKLEAQRQENLRRIAGLAGATGGAEAKGTAQRASGPSDSYAGRIRARVKPNIVFSDDLPGNPTAEVEVRMAPDGTITGKRVLKSSGFKGWDEAVLRALDKTEVLPRDVDGRVHSPLVLLFRSKDF